MRKKYEFATWLRATGVIMILLCHLVVQNSNSIVQMTGQFFNIGVEIFIILSGFLFGVRGGINSIKNWYVKRLKRIYIPYELFIIFLALVHIGLGYSICSIDWLWFILGFQGSVVGVLGAEQTWFITPLLICYAITPVIERIICSIKNQYRLQIFGSCIFALPVVWALFENPAVHTLLSLISYYIVGFIFGYKFNQIKLSWKRALIALGIMCCSFVIRIIMRHFFDGTMIYGRIVVGYTQVVSAFCIFYIFADLFQNINPAKIVEIISNISFEIYLIHYMFCVGPVRIFGLTPSWILDCSVIILISIIMGFILNKISDRIIEKLE